MGIDTLLSESLYTLGFILVVGVASIPAWLLWRSRINTLEKKGRTSPLKMTILCALLSIISLLVVQPPKDFSVFAPVIYMSGVTLLWSILLILGLRFKKKNEQARTACESHH
ncbi:hypothetical protein [Enterovibrio paralichthyis]|uniref:hypothetical protein n=1 Tax=Enterovibrio paralichthyis TaxID=2853805 RepID=UPI001C48BDCA|nr:hypothetical protein [Enterovibrio paralichthyis]MBV7296273.1 hypothetical protein [Enterovibrio paralichthyis]